MFFMARLEGFEPPAFRFEVYCSIQLSYRRKKKWSGRPDSNWRPPAPKAGALTKLRYAPTKTLYLYKKNDFSQ